MTGMKKSDSEKEIGVYARYHLPMKLLLQDIAEFTGILEMIEEEFLKMWISKWMGK